MEQTSKPSRAWYLLPIFLGWVGGLIMFFVIKDENRKMAKNGLILGVLLSGIATVVFIVYSVYVQLQMQALMQQFMGI